MADTAVNLTSKLERLSLQEMAYSGFTHKWKIKYTDIAFGSGSTDTVTVTLGNTPTDWVCTRAAINVITEFAGAGGFAVEIGTDGDPNNFITSTSVKTAGPTVVAVGADPVTLTASFAAASDVLQALFTCSSSGSPSALTAGEIDIFLGIVGLNDCG